MIVVFFIKLYHKNDITLKPRFLTTRFKYETTVRTSFFLDEIELERVPFINKVRGSGTSSHV